MRDVPTGKSLLSFWSLGERHIPKKFNFDFAFKKIMIVINKTTTTTSTTTKWKGEEKKYLTEQDIALNSGLQ